MTNDPFPFFTHLTQGQLGQLFGATSHQVGRWLVEVGLRGVDKQPTLKAIDGGYLKIVSSEDGPRFPAWEKELTVVLLEKSGHKRLGIEEEIIAQPQQLPRGPFAARQSSTDGDGFEIVSGDGTVAVWCRGERLADRLAWLMTIADKYGRLN